MKPAASIISPSSESDLSIVHKRLAISSAMIPVEVFVIFLIRNDERFTVCGIIDVFEARHKIRLKFSRMQQILTEMVEAGKVRRSVDIGKRKKQVSYYSFNRIA